MELSRPCPCGAPSELCIGNLPVCRECYEAALSVEGSIMPTLDGNVVVRTGNDVRKKRLPDSSKPSGP